MFDSIEDHQINLEKTAMMLSGLAASLRFGFAGAVRAEYGHAESVADLVPELAQNFITNALSAYKKEVNPSPDVWEELSSQEFQQALIISLLNLEDLTKYSQEQLDAAVVKLKQSGMHLDPVTSQSFGNFVFKQKNPSWLAAEA